MSRIKINQNHKGINLKICEKEWDKFLVTTTKDNIHSISKELLKITYVVYMNDQIIVTLIPL